MPQRRRYCHETPPAILASLSDEDLLARIIQRAGDDPDPHACAQRIFAAFDRWQGLARASPYDLQALAGLQPSLAEILAAAVEIGVRCCERTTPPVPSIRCSVDVLRVIGPRLRLLDHEQLWMVGVDGGNHPVGARRLAEGGRHGCAVLARDVLRVALSMGAVAFILAHNHPGGDPTPSRHDLHLTRAIARAASVIGLPLLDHVIVTPSAHVSMLDVGLFERTEQDDRATVVLDGRAAG